MANLRPMGLTQAAGNLVNAYMMGKQQRQQQQVNQLMGQALTGAASPEQMQQLAQMNPQALIEVQGYLDQRRQAQAAQAAQAAQQQDIQDISQLLVLDDAGQQQWIQERMEGASPEEMAEYDFAMNLPFSQRKEFLTNQARQLGMDVPRIERSAFVNDLIAAGMVPGSEEFQDAILDKHGKGKTIGYDVKEGINPETGQIEYMQVSRTDAGDFKFLGVEVPSEAQRAGISGGINSIDQANNIMSKATGGQTKSAGYAYRLNEANKALSELEPNIDFDSRALQMALTPSSGFFTGALDEAARRSLNPQEQKYVAEIMEFVRAALRQESGAVIGADEMSEEIKKYIPRPGDSPEVIKSKAQLRQRKINEQKAQAGQAFDAMNFLTAQGMDAAPTQPDATQPTEPAAPTAPATGMGEAEADAFIDELFGL